MAVGCGQFVNKIVIILLTRPLSLFTPPNERFGMKLNRSSRSGFTLIEIMIVVAIIGMLAGIAVPNYVKAREQAHRTACISNLQQIDGAVQLWAMESKKDAEQPVTYADISSYLKNSLACPAGGSSFADSYLLTTVESKPACQRKPGSHRLPQ